VEVVRKASALADLACYRESGPLVLVPTMGALHPGHLSLVRAAAVVGPVVVSIFVNPTQFAEGEDLAAYPQDLAADLEVLSACPVAAVFAPDVGEVYGSAAEVTIQPGSRGQGLCGAGRPGHFAGVLTVVAKLFGMVQPAVAVFGRKDAQQCLVIRQMVEDLRLRVRLVDLPTVREPDGLAMSSRNRYLDESQRVRARCLSRGLEKARSLIVGGQRQVAPVLAAIRSCLTEADRVEYAEVRQVPNLEKLDRLDGTVLLAVAAKIGPARLIDNLVLDVSGTAVRDGHLMGTFGDL